MQISMYVACACEETLEIAMAYVCKSRKQFKSRSLPVWATHALLAPRMRRARAPFAAAAISHCCVHPSTHGSMRV